MRRFIADASHELRTPLTRSSGFGELYKQARCPPGGDGPHRYRGAADETAGRGLADAGEGSMRTGRCNPGRSTCSLASDAVHSARAAAPDRDIGASGPDGRSAGGVRGREPAHAGAAQSHQQRDRAHPADAAITVGIEADDSTHLVLSVTDTGNGLTEEEVAHVFERFYRGDASRHRGEGGGSGWVVDRRGPGRGARGTVGVDSAPGRAPGSGAIAARGGLSAGRPNRERMDVGPFVRQNPGRGGSGQ